MVAWSLKCNIWNFLFLDFHEPGENSIKSISHAQHTIFISAECPVHTLQYCRIEIQYHNLQEFYRTTKVNR